jgi:hypothetical protein
VKQDSLTRRKLLSRAGLALGGAVTLGVLNACSSDDDPATITDPGTCPEPPVCPDTAAAIKDYPYEKFIPAGFQFDKAAVQEAAYHAYYTGGGCGHGAYSALLADLAKTDVAPFNQLPLRFGQFGFGGVAGYGSICGAALGGALIINSVVADVTARNNMITGLMRWYETFAFPEYAPTEINADEAAAAVQTDPAKKLQLAWPDGVVQVAPGSHLCHASVSSWCASQDPIVAAGGANQPDKKARCARVTADVAGKVAEMVNAYLATGSLGARTFAPLAPDSSVTGCTSCHGGAVNQHGGAPVPPVASGMSCPACHTEKLPLSGATHSTLTSCSTCHP